MKTKLTIAFFLLPIFFSSCGLLVNGSMQKDLIKRASFDLNCKAENLELTELQKLINGVIVSYGVIGCNKKAVYLFSDNTWILNSEIN